MGDLGRVANPKLVATIKTGLGFAVRPWTHLIMVPWANQVHIPNGISVQPFLQCFLSLQKANRQTD